MATRPSVRVHTWRGEAAVTLATGDLSATFLRLPGTPRRDWVLRLPACRRYVLRPSLLPTGRGFVCFEPMTSPVNALIDGTVPLTRSPYRAAFTVSVRSASPAAGR